MVSALDREVRVLGQDTLLSRYLPLTIINKYKQIVVAT